jgi:hypothetical protein
MKILTSLMVGAALNALTPPAALAGIPSMSFAVHDIIVSSNIPALNIAVRNLSSSPDPALRDLRVTSPTPALTVNGQVWCKSFQNAHTRADAARVIFGNGMLASSPGGSDFVGGWSASAIRELGGNEEVRNYSINAPVNLPDNGGAWIGFNPVQHVEDRLENFVQNGAGSEADFLRGDDVFETTIEMNVVGWCEYDGQNVQGRYAGVRQIEVPVHIFYHGDPDIEDQVTVVGTPGSVQARPPARQRGDASRPARRQDPARNDDRRSDRRRDDDQARRDPDSAERGGVFVASGDIDGDGRQEGLLLPAIQRQHDPEAMEPEARQCSAIESTLRREAGNLVTGWILGSDRPRRDSRRQSGRDRLVEDTVDRVMSC